MDSEIFIGLVAVLAVIYAVVAKLIQNRFVDRKQMEDYQAKMRELSQEYEKAKKAGDSKRMQESLDKQMAFMPEMNKIMFAQFKPMIFLIVIFAVFSWLIGMLDTTIKDDFILNLTDDGKNCDSFAGDGVYSTCYRIDNTNFGKWTLTGIFYESGHEIGRSQSYFQYGTSDNDSYVESPRGEVISLQTDKTEYTQGEEIKIYATPSNMTAPGLFGGPRKIDIQNVQVVVSNGTYFRADLPITIPILNWKAFYQPIVWFIFISFILNIAIGFVMNKKKANK
jgi:hypothetical protein